MVSQEKDGRFWQMGKSALECHEYMFDHQVACDVTFVVQSPGGAPHTRLGAHKYVLVCRSPVFEAMFSGSYTESSGEIDIKDAPADEFKEMLRFLYTDKVQLTPDNVLQMAMTAKKYLLSTLEQKCTDYLKSNLDTDNVCVLYDESRHLDDESLTETCRALITIQFSNIIRGDSFLEVPKDVLMTILGWEDLGVFSEMSLFNACVKWTKHNYPAQDQREILREIARHVRFGSIDIKEFAQNEELASVLGDREVRHVYNLQILGDMATKAQQHLVESGYNVGKRRLMHTVTRMSRVHERDVLAFDTDQHVVAVKVSEPVELCGVSVYGCHKRQKNLTCTIELRVSKRWSEMITATIVSDGTETPQRVLFDKPTVLQPDVQYALRYTAEGVKSLFGVDGRDTVTSAGVVFTFSKDSNYYRYHMADGGQLPELHFRLTTV